MAIAKLGGLDAREAEAQGIDPSCWRKKGGAQSGVFGKPWVRANGGLSFDGMAEQLYEYFKPGDTYTANGPLDMIDQELGGNKVYTAAGLEAAAEREHAERLSMQDIANVDALAMAALEDETLYDSLQAINDLPPFSEIYTDDEIESIIAGQEAIEQERTERLADRYAATEEGTDVEVGGQARQSAQRGSGKEVGFDLFGQDTRKAQAVADTSRAKDEKRSGTNDAPVESGDFFGQGDGKLEPDLFDQQTAAITTLVAAVKKLAGKVDAITKESAPSLSS